MAIDKIASATRPALEGPRQGFDTLRETGPRKVMGGTTAPASHSAAAERVASGPTRVEGSRVEGAGGARVHQAARAVEQVAAAQGRLDNVLRMAQSGKTFTPAELLGLQAQVYQASQEIDLAGKVVEKATSGIKQILQTQV